MCKAHPLFGREAALCMECGRCYDQSLAQDAGELIVPVVGGVAGAQDPLERDRGGDGAFAGHLREDLQHLLAREDLLLAFQSAFQVLASAHWWLKIDFVRVCGEPGRSAGSCLTASAPPLHDASSHES